MMDWYGSGPGWGGWLVMTLMMLTFWALLIVGVLAVVRSSRRDDHRSNEGRRGAEQLLDDRLARGEIDAAEYRERRELLRSGH